jgi:hypothetical protein
MILPSGSFFEPSDAENACFQPDQLGDLTTEVYVYAYTFICIRGSYDDLGTREYELKPMHRLAREQNQRVMRDNAVL